MSIWTTPEREQLRKTVRAFTEREILPNVEEWERTGDLPRDLHRRLRGVAARRGCSARQLILRSIERLVAEEEPALPERRLPLSPPLIPPAGRRIDLTNDQIYDLIALP